MQQKQHFGIELDVPDSNAHNGTHGKREKPYFNCAANRGIFVVLKQIQENLGSSSSKWLHHKYSRLKEQRVILNVHHRVQTLIGGSGTIRYLGNPGFLDDLMFGVELDHRSPNASNGFVNEEEYFECEQGKGFFVGEESIVKRLAEGDNKLITPEEMDLPQLQRIPRMHDKVKLIDGQIGVVKFVGQLESSADTMIGVNLDNWSPNGNDGCAAGKKYFRCEPGHGYFVRLEHIAHNMGSTISTPIKQSVCFHYVSFEMLRHCEFHFVYAARSGSRGHLEGSLENWR